MRWTYARPAPPIPPVAKALLASGLGKGTRVGVLMGNRPEAVASLFGAALAGAVAVPLSTFSPKPELSYLLAHADISVLLLQTTMGARRFAADVADLCPAAAGLAPFGDPPYPYLRHVAVLGPPEDAAGLALVGSLPGTRSGGRDRRRLLDAVAAQVHPSDLASSSTARARPTARRASCTTTRPSRCSGGRRPSSVRARRVDACVVPAPVVLDRRAQRGDGRHARRRRHVGDAGEVRAGPRAVGSSSASASPSRTCSRTRPERSRSTRTGRPPTSRRAPRCTASRCSPGTRRVQRRPELEHAGRLRHVRDGVVPHRPPVRRTPATCFRNGSYGRLLPGNELRVVDPETGAGARRRTRKASSSCGARP